MKKLTAILMSVLCLCSCSKTAKTPPSSDVIPEIHSMTLQQKVGQLFMVRCDSITTDDIKKLQPGGIIMFSSDFDGLTKDGVRDKINNFNELSNIAPYIAVDEEGGSVVRVSSHPELASEKFQSPQYYYNEGGIELVLEKTAEKSDLLVDLGINTNLAPVADVSENPNHFIYDRTLGRNASETADYVALVVETMKEHNIASCLKHFPGYGGNVDTHTDIAIDNRPVSQFREVDFLPFKAGIDAGADFVLVSHNIMADVDDTMPATLSKPVHDILRNELGFNGIIITDDMAMAAAANYEKAYKSAVLAGNDMIIVTDFKAAFDEVLNAVENGEIPEETIDNAVERILNNKKERKIL